MPGLFEQISRDVLGAGAAFAGNALRLPELGISERLQGGGKAQTLTNAALGSPNSGSPLFGGGAAPGTTAQANTGNVLGINTSAGQPLQINNPVGGNPAAPLGGANNPTFTPPGPDLASLQSLASQGINDYYAKIMPGFDAQRQGILQDQGSFANQIGKNYQNQVQEQGNQLSSAQEQVNQNKADIDKNQQEAYSDLDTGLRNAIDSFARQLGAYGATDSSAAEMGKYAFARLGSQQKTEVLKQANDLRAQADRQFTNIKTLYQQNLQKLAQWRDEQLFNLNNQVTQQLRQIDQQKTQATADQAKQLSDLAIQIKQQAINNAQQVLASVGAATSSIDQRYQPQLQAAQGDLQKMEFTLGSLNIDPSGYAVDLNNGGGLTQGLGYGQAQIAAPQSVSGLSYAPGQAKKKEQS